MNSHRESQARTQRKSLPIHRRFSNFSPAPRTRTRPSPRKQTRRCRRSRSRIQTRSRSRSRRSRRRVRIRTRRSRRTLIFNQRRPTTSATSATSVMTAKMHMTNLSQKTFRRRNEGAKKANPNRRGPLRQKQKQSTPPFHSLALEIRFVTSFNETFQLDFSSYLFSLFKCFNRFNLLI